MSCEVYMQSVVPLPLDLGHWKISGSDELTVPLMAPPTVSADAAVMLPPRSMRAHAEAAANCQIRARDSCAFIDAFPYLVVVARRRDQCQGRWWLRDR